MSTRRRAGSSATSRCTGFRRPRRPSKRARPTTRCAPSCSSTCRPGPPRSINERHFYVFGAKPEPLLPVAGSYAVDAGDRADEPVLDRADATLEATLHEKGWWHAAVVARPRVGRRRGHRTGRPARPHRRGAALHGALRRATSTTTADVLGSALGLDKETDRSSSHLAEKIRAFYQKRGFLDAEVRAEARGRRERRRAPPCLSRRRARACTRRRTELSVPQGRRHQAPRLRRAALVVRHRHGDRQLPGRRAARRRLAGRPRPPRRRRDDRRGRRPGGRGRSPGADRLAAGRHLRRGHLRARGRSRAGALQERRVLARHRGPRGPRASALRPSLSAAGMHPAPPSAAPGGRVRLRPLGPSHAGRAARPQVHVPAGPRARHRVRPDRAARRSP